MTRTSLIGKVAIGLACFLPIGCSTLPSNPTPLQLPQPTCQASENIPSASNNNHQDLPQSQESNQPKLSAYIQQSVGDIVLNAGVHQGEFPSSYTELGITTSNNLGNLTAWKAESYTNQGKHAETDHGLTAILPIKDTNLSTKLGLWDWTFEDNTHHSVGVLGLIYTNKNLGFSTSLTTLHDLNEGGSLYVLPISQRLTSPEAKIPISAKLKTTYSDGFLGGAFRHGFNHITLGLEAELYDNRTTRITAGFHHQFGMQDNIPTMLYGGVTVNIQTSDLLGEKK